MHCCLIPHCLRSSDTLSQKCGRVFSHLLCSLQAARPGLTEREPAVQKKCYKVLAYLCEQVCGNAIVGKSFRKSERLFSCSRRLFHSL